jgi:aspartate-semialdehyde dehydrogenase
MSQAKKRVADDVPILVPGVNLAHAAQIRRQRAERGWRGFVAPLPNLDNVIPYIPGEEEKVARETAKILGAAFPEAVAVSLGAPATPADVAAAFREFGGELGRLGLPSAPRRLITVHDDPLRPLDRDADGGMTTSVGRIREDPALEHGVRYVLVSHNTKMGAAKGAVLTAEYLATAGNL